MVNISLTSRDHLSVKINDDGDNNNDNDDDNKNSPHAAKYGPLRALKSVRRIASPYSQIFVSRL